MHLNVTSHVLKASDHYPYHLVAKRYTTAAADDPTAITLILTHATGMHKECWEPILERIFAEPDIKIRGAWTIDSPNHGEAAVLNERRLQTDWIDDCKLRRRQPTHASS